MQLDDAVQMIKYRLGNFNSTAMDAAIIAEMNQVQSTTLEGGDFQPWFMLTESSSAQTTANEERLQVPENFIMEWEEGALWYKETTATAWKPLPKEDYDFLRGRYAAEGAPKGYAEAGLYFLLVPQPILVYDVKMRYYANQPANVNGTDENVWLKYASDWLIAETGLIIANNYVHNKSAAEGFVVLAKSAKARIEKLNVAKQEANRERMMGE